jgi:hypothetical protein
MSKKKKGRKPLNQAQAAKFVLKELRKIRGVTKSASPFRAVARALTPAQDVANYRNRLDREIWRENLADDDPATRATARMITKSSGYRGPSAVLQPCLPWDPRERDVAWRAEFGFKEDR